MATFDNLELSWLRATKALFEQKDFTDILDLEKRKDLFVEELENLLSTQSDKSKVTALVDKIDVMPTEDFWDFYRRDFA